MFSKTQTETNVNRRSWLKKIGVGALVGAAGMITSRKATAQTTDEQSIWTHGTATQVQFADRLDLIEYRSTGAFFKGQPGTDNWFHLPITVPVFLNGGRPSVVVALVALNTSDGVFLRESRVSNGDRIIGMSQDLNESGEVFHRIEITEPVLFLGVNISVRVEFSNLTGSSELEIISAGLDMNVPV